MLKMTILLSTLLMGVHGYLGGKWKCPCCNYVVHEELVVCPYCGTKNAPPKPAGYQTPRRGGQTSQRSGGSSAGSWDYDGQLKNMDVGHIDDVVDQHIADERRKAAQRGAYRRLLTKEHRDLIRN